MKTYLRVCVHTLVCFGAALMFFGNSADAQMTYSLTGSGATGTVLSPGDEVTVQFTLVDDTGAGVVMAAIKLTAVGLDILSSERMTDSNGELRVTVKLTSRIEAYITAEPQPVSTYAVRNTVIFTCCYGHPDVSPPVIPTRTAVSVSPSSVPSPIIGKQLTFSLTIAAGENVAGYQATVEFDTAALRYVSSNNGDYLPPGAFAVPAVVKENQVMLAATSLAGESNGDGTLATLTFEVIAIKASILRLSEVVLSDSAGVGFRPRVEDGEVVEPPQVVGDVNWDGVVNILDLVFVAGRFGQTDKNSADLNGDGIVNIQDLVLVAGAFGNAAAAPPTYPKPAAMLNASDVKQWLAQARLLGLTDAISQRGIFILERLLAALAPKETALLPNYPNPFNPETWIPYHLANAADVRITVYDTKGALVRQLDLGHQPAGFYTDRGRAAYWDGRNHSGESAASGTYFYQLRAGDYSQMRRMVIVK